MNPSPGGAGKVAVFYLTKMGLATLSALCEAALYQCAPCSQPAQNPKPCYVTKAGLPLFSTGPLHCTSPSHRL